MNYHDNTYYIYTNISSYCKDNKVSCELLFISIKIILNINEAEMNYRVEIVDNKLRHVPRGVFIRPHIKVVIIVKTNKSLHSPRARTIILHILHTLSIANTRMRFIFSSINRCDSNWNQKTNHSWNKAMTGWKIANVIWIPTQFSLLCTHTNTFRSTDTFNIHDRDGKWRLSEQQRLTRD